MIAPPFRLLVLNVPPDCADDVQRRLAIDGGKLAVQAEVHAEGAELGAASEGADIAVIDGRSDAADAFRLLADVRRRIPRIPIVLAPGRPRDAARPSTTTVGDGLFLIDVSIEDDAFLQRITEAVAGVRPQCGPSRADLDAADREIANLNAVCGPSAMSTSSGLLGSRPLREAAPERFSELSRDYKSLLDRALVLRVRDAEEEVSARLQALADHLGTLNAGPRDVVDMHRTVIAELVHDQVPQKARAYIDEGRLVLVQLMGYLAAYYRSLTWGGRRLAPARSRP